jgi:hypothetical protein
MLDIAGEADTMGEYRTQLGELRERCIGPARSAIDDELALAQAWNERLQRMAHEAPSAVALSEAIDNLSGARPIGADLLSEAALADKTVADMRQTAPLEAGAPSLERMDQLADSIQVEGLDYGPDPRIDGY